MLLEGKREHFNSRGGGGGRGTELFKNRSSGIFFYYVFLNWPVLNHKIQMKVKLSLFLELQAIKFFLSAYHFRNFISRCFSLWLEGKRTRAIINSRGLGTQLFSNATSGVLFTMYD